MMPHRVYQLSNGHAPVLLEFLQHPRSTLASHCRNSFQGFSSMPLGMGCPALRSWVLLRKRCLGALATLDAKPYQIFSPSKKLKDKAFQREPPLLVESKSPLLVESLNLMPSACAWIRPKAPTVWRFLFMLKAWSRSIDCTSSWLLPYEPVLVTSVRSNGGSYGRQRLSKPSWAGHWRLCRLCKLQKFEQVTACWKCTSCTIIPSLPNNHLYVLTCSGMSWLLFCTFPEPPIPSWLQV